VFEEGTNGPNARAQNVKALVATIAGWVKNPPEQF